MPSCGVPEAGVSTIQVVADRREARLVDETREQHLPENARRGRSGQRRGNLSLRADRNRLRVGRDRDAGLHDVALRGDHAALRVELEGTVAGVGGAPSGIATLKKPSPRMATSRSLPVGDQRALRHQPRRAGGLDARAELDAGRQDVALRRSLRADAA